MRRSENIPRRVTFLAPILLAWVASGCTTGPASDSRPPEVLIASDRVVQVNLANGRIQRQRLLPGAATDLALAPRTGHLAVATRWGAVFLVLPNLEVGWNEKLGIVDAIEISLDARHAYLLLHPGDHPEEATGDHTLLEVDFPAGTHRREARLDSRAYDLLMDAPTGAIYVTDLIGRVVHRVDAGTFAVTDHEISLGQSPAEEPRGAFLRLLLPGRQPDELFVVEDLRDAARVWRWQPAAGTLDPHPLPEVVPPVLGGGPLGAAPEGGLWLFTRSHFLRLDANLRVKDRIALADSASAHRFAGGSPATHRFGASDGRAAVLLGPAPPAHGRPRARAVWINLAQGGVAGERLLDLQAGPMVILSPETPATTREAATR
jgi:hypothetical protein